MAGELPYVLFSDISLAGVWRPLDSAVTGTELKPCEACPADGWKCSQNLSTLPVKHLPSIFKWKTCQADSTKNLASPGGKGCWRK